MKEKLSARKPVWFYRICWKAKKENEIDLGLFFELAEEIKIMYNRIPVNTLIEDMEKLRNGSFTNDYFTLGHDDGEIDTNRFFKDSNELAKLIDKKSYKHDDHPGLYYTGNVSRYFRNFKRVNRSEHGRGAIEFNNIQEYKRINCYIPSGNACFL